MIFQRQNDEFRGPFYAVAKLARLSRKCVRISSAKNCSKMTISLGDINDVAKVAQLRTKN